ncbi:MAG TPA: hypothetical protein VJV79_19680 [Polyangiaceae bacterium]|nr:hypothetical protein [Polyangiaceae bacterium]
MRRLIAPGFALALLVGCGSDGNGSPGTGGISATAGSTANGGTATGGASSGGTSSAGTGGSSGAGGAATGGKSGAGGAGTGGKSGGTGGRPSTGGAGTSGGSSSMGGAPTTPQGPVDTCREDICPLGPCDNGGFFSDDKCSDVYPNPVSKDSMFCAAGVDGGYCLTTITNVLTYWAITCSGGTPTFHLCNAGCMLMANVATCN